MNTTTTTIPTRTRKWRIGHTYTGAQINAAYHGTVPVGHSYRYVGRIRGWVTFERIGSTDVYYCG